MYKRTVNLPDNFVVPSKKDIHGHRSLMDSLRIFPEFAEYNISNRCPNEKVMKGLTVVEKSWTQEEEKTLGTIIKESVKEVDVQWDKPGPIVTSLKLSELRLFDNGGVLHNNVACSECNTYPLRGLRWKCINCDDYDLCTFCYMADAHNLRHIFIRFKRNDSKGVEIPQRLPLKFTGYAFACGILQNAVVNLRKNSKKKGEVLEIGVANGIDVEWQKTKHGNKTSYKTSRHNILDLQYENPILFPFYPDHLPVLQKGDTFDHLDIKFSEEHTTQKVQLRIRRMSSEDQKGSHKPVLYLIFDNQQESYQELKDSFAVMDEIFEYSKKTKLPCHVVNQRMLFLHGSTTTVCIHSKTSNETIEVTVKQIAH
ncbi:MIB [Mytilus coruscus]|uniref:MIB n=1 Tax=Mytilus coruscus TaxID=42192 RepID=A0A6J8EPI5_MYTCO|nr:MIB [Mytilus coruscus]